MWTDSASPSHDKVAAHDRRVSSPSDAQALIGELRETMAALEKVLTVETEHLRVGRINDGLADSERKSALTSAYLQGLEALKANAVALARFAPQGLEILKREHATFARVIETNQVVLATARAVSENLVKGISEELGRSQRPQVYGASGPQHRPATGATPLLVSKSL
jgi:pantothenate synthetase